MRCPGLPGRVIALVAGLAVAATVVARPAPAPAAAPAKSAPAKSAKPAKKSAAPVPKLVLEPKAMDLLKATGSRLAVARSMSFTAVVGYEYPSKLGPPIVYSTRYDVTMQRPDKLRILMPADGPASEFYYDGKTMMAFAPVENLAAVAEAPPTIDAMLKVAFEKAALYFPFTDVLATDPYAALANGAILAYYIGPSAVIGGTKTDMLVWANRDVHVQMWIGADDKLPRRMRAIFSADPLKLRHEMEFSNWQLDPALPADTFTSAKALAAGRMAFKAPGPPPRGARPITENSPKAAPVRTPAKSN